VNTREIIDILVGTISLFLFLNYLEFPHSFVITIVMLFILGYFIKPKLKNYLALSTEIDPSSETIKEIQTQLMIDKNKNESIIAEGRHTPRMGKLG